MPNDNVIESLPVTPTQPNREYYGGSDIALLQKFTRESYLKKFGEQAPDFDASQRMKDWFDSSQTDPNSMVTYKYFDASDNGATKLKEMSMSQWLAARINLPGAHSYAPYVVRETNATAWGQPVNKIYLSLRSQVDEIVVALGKGDVVDTGEGFVNYPPDEPRREWAIKIGAGTELGPQTVGFLLLTAYARGIGSPGKWSLKDSLITWTPDPVGPSNSDKPGFPVPVRDLLPNEELHPFPFGAQIHRKDLSTQSTGGGMDAATKAAIEEILKLVRAMAAKNA